MLNTCYFLLLTLLTSTSYAITEDDKLPLTSDKICQIDSKEEEKKEINKSNDKLLKDFALSPRIRANSETMLSNLITAKSPMITSWVKARGLDPLKSPEIVAYEWLKYYSKNFILQRYPSGDKEIDNKIETTFDLFIKTNFDDKTRSKFETAFLAAKSHSKMTLENFKLTKADKDVIFKKLDASKLYWPKDLKSSKYALAPLEFIDWSLSYDPLRNEINVGINALQYNDQSLQSALLHELAHSFDSCRWGQEYKTRWPFESVGACLRSLAKTRDDSKLELFHKNGKLSAAEFQKLKSNPTCNNSVYPPIGLQADQLPETFADWFSAEATPIADIDGRFRSDLCVDHKLNEGSSYLSNEDRLKKVFLANINIQKKLNINLPVTTCQF